MEDKVKQIIVLRKDLKMSCGKAVSQGAHASGAAVNMESSSSHWDNETFIVTPSDPALNDWLLNERFTKVVVSVDSEQELKDLYEKAKAAGLRCSYIVDEGLTEFNNVQTPTAVGIGPDYSSVLDPITGHLPLYR